MPTGLDEVTVLLVTFESAHCLPELAEHLPQELSVIVVDNGSTDQTASAVAQYLPQALWLPQGRNLGFGAANNIAWAAARTPFVLLLNPDCAPQPGAFAELLDTAKRFPNAALVGPQLLDRRGQPDLSHRWFSPGWRSTGPAASATACVGFISGACMLIRREAMARVRGFDESFFLYYEDDDLCIRLAREVGPLLIEPRAKVQHFSRGSVRGGAPWRAEYRRGFHHIQSKFLFRQKHLGRIAVPLERWRFAALGASEALLRLLTFDWRRAARAWGRARGALNARRGK